jgi:hypothetical protein
VLRITAKPDRRCPRRVNRVDLAMSALRPLTPDSDRTTDIAGGLKWAHKLTSNSILSKVRSPDKPTSCCRFAHSLPNTFPLRTEQLTLVTASDRISTRRPVIGLTETLVWPDWKPRPVVALQAVKPPSKFTTVR